MPHPDEHPTMSVAEYFKGLKTLPFNADTAEADLLNARGLQARAEQERDTARLRWREEVEVLSAEIAALAPSQARIAELEQQLAESEAAVSTLRNEVGPLKESAKTNAARTVQAITEARSLLSVQDIDALHAGIARIVDFAEAPEIARVVAEREAEIATKLAELEALKAKAGV